MAKYENTSSGVGSGLIALGGNLENPRDAKASDWPAVGPTGPAGESSGEGELVKQSFEQTGPRHGADSGANTPSVWGQAGKDYKVVVSKGEGGSPSTSVKCDWSINLENGSIVPDVVKYPA